jgi:flagellin
MALGVLNNLSAIYAEHNLNNTNASLQTVLQQLSSGSRINSGADDAAGLSLVNGLEANSTALTQSETNATEGVGLLQVADGALSQVTSLLNRAVTLATEASNGTLNSTQEGAANQEYQSILAEITNIGSTTTYNQEQVFNGSDVAIYTGDSSQAGASVDDLSIRTLSASSMGDTNGAMSYSTSKTSGNVFVDLTAGTTATGNTANINDYLNGGAAGTTKVDITTLSSNGSPSLTVITVGGGSGYENTAAGLISAINNKNLGVKASFTTAAVAGDSSATSTDTGIMLSGSVGVGANPSVASYSGTITGGNANAGTDKLTGSIAVQVGNGAPVTVTMDEVAAEAGVSAGAVTMADLANYLTANSSLGVAANIDPTTGVMTLNSSAAGNPALKVTSNLTDTSLSTGGLAYTATAAYSVGISIPTFANNGVVDSAVGVGGGNASYTPDGSQPAVQAAGTVGTITENASGELSGKITILDTRGNAIVTGLELGVAATGTGVNSGTATYAELAATLTAYAAADPTAHATFSAGGSGVTVAQTLDASGTADVNVTIGTDTSAGIGQSTSAADSVVPAGSTTSGGMATISYSDSAGASLSGTDLLNTADAQTALNDLNAAISDVAAMDGYIGAQINTLNSISQVMSTQQENVVSAQNAIQATDYASATSDMSKYEILSQTGIAALAQANSVQQEVTKLLQ